jgi:hypothetical protein
MNGTDVPPPTHTAAKQGVGKMCTNFYVLGFHKPVFLVATTVKE